MIVALTLALAAFGLWVSDTSPWLPAAIARIARTGWAATILFVAALAVTPVARIWPAVRARQVSLRRRLGVAACALAALHAGYVLSIGWVPAPRFLLYEPHLRSGATAAGILALLALTSSPRVVRALRLGHWKPLHRAVYAAAALVAHHVALSSHAEPRHVLALAVVLAVLLASRLVRFLILQVDTSRRPSI